MEVWQIQEVHSLQLCAEKPIGGVLGDRGEGGKPDHGLRPWPLKWPRGGGFRVPGWLLHFLTGAWWNPQEIRTAHKLAPGRILVIHFASARNWTIGMNCTCEPIDGPVFMARSHITAGAVGPAVKDFMAIPNFWQLFALAKAVRGWSFVGRSPSHSRTKHQSEYVGHWRVEVEHRQETGHRDAGRDYLSLAGGLLARCWSGWRPGKRPRRTLDCRRLP